MSSRREFMRNTMMAFAISLVPKILQPQEIAASLEGLRKKYAYFYKIPTVMADDTLFMEVHLPRIMKERAERDPNKPKDAVFERTQIGFNGDDFPRAIVTVCDIYRFK